MATRLLYVCEGGECTERGSGDLHDKIKEQISSFDPQEERVKVRRYPCFGACEYGINVTLFPDKVFYSHVKEEDVPEIIDHVLGEGKPVARLMGQVQPDIEEFIQCKAAEERKAWSLIDAGYDGSFGGEAYSSIMFQNSNNSVRVSDAFMEAVINDDDWHTRAVTEPSKVMTTYKARDLMRLVSEAAHQCGDPGLQFDTTVNRWHTSPNSGRINASNPCSEFMFLDNSACNLASLNLRNFQDEEGELNVEAFCRAADLIIAPIRAIALPSSGTRRKPNRSASAIT